MASPLLPAHLQPGSDPVPARRLATALLLLGGAELVIWVLAALRSYYGSPGCLLLPVQASTEFAGAHRPLSTILDAAAGTYFTGTQGTLLYRPTELSDLFFFFSVGDFTALDALFFAGLGLYLHRVLRGLAVGPGFMPTIGQAISRLGLATMCLFVLKMVLTSAATELFWVRSHHQFQLLSKNTGSGSYSLFGLLLLLCGRLLQRGPQL